MTNCCYIGLDKQFGNKNISLVNDAINFVERTFAVDTYISGLMPGSEMAAAAQLVKREKRLECVLLSELQASDWDECDRDNFYELCFRSSGETILEHKKGDYMYGYVKYMIAKANVIICAFDNLSSPKLLDKVMHCNKDAVFVDLINNKIFYKKPYIRLIK